MMTTRWLLSIRVPMIMAGPGIGADAVDTRYAYLSDILPTVASLLGLPAPVSCEGRALLGRTANAPRANGYF